MRSTALSLPSALLAAVLLVASASARPATDDARLDYEALAKSWLTRHGLPAASPADVDLEKIFREKFVVAQAGIFDLMMLDTRVAEISGARDLGDLTAALLRLQTSWLGFTADPSEATERSRDDLKILEKWFKSFKPALCVSSMAAGEREFFAANQIKDDPLEALQRLRAAMLAGSAIGLAREGATPSRIALLPDRKEFVEFLALVGWQDESLRQYYWVPGIENWTEFFWEDVRVLALQYAEPKAQPGAYERGLDMNEDNPNRMAEQVAQIAANAMLENYYGERMPSAMITGISMCLVIDVFGEIDTRVDGDLRTRETQGKSIFIPGGQSEGGRLPKFSAENDWRSEQGRGWFLRQLRQSQKGGASEVKSGGNKLAAFQLKDFAQSARHVVHAPFFGAAAGNAAPPPDAFAGDMQELLRAYKTAFLHWLRTQASGKKESPADFGALLRGFTKDDALTRFEALFQELYEAPLSDGTASGDSLEGQFLAWLSKQKT